MLTNIQEYEHTQEFIQLVRDQEKLWVLMGLEPTSFSPLVGNPSNWTTQPAFRNVHEIIFYCPLHLIQACISIRRVVR